MKSGINPFDSQEAKPYKNDPEILAMTNLVRYVLSFRMGNFVQILFLFRFSFSSVTAVVNYLNLKEIYLFLVPIKTMISMSSKRS